MVKLTYRPARARGHLAMVGKGVMYDSGGISLKPSDPMHAAMKMDMSGAAAVLSSMSALSALELPRRRDRVPAVHGQHAVGLGDEARRRADDPRRDDRGDPQHRCRGPPPAGRRAVARHRGQPDAIVDIATLTGACLVALGPAVAGVLGNRQSWVDQVTAASHATDEPVWQLPLETKRYRKLLDSDIADVKNVGGPYGGAITAAVFLSEFVGELPWAHLDIAGPMKVDADESWRSKGATGFGTRLLIELALGFNPPAA